MSDPDYDESFDIDVPEVSIADEAILGHTPAQIDVPEVDIEDSWGLYLEDLVNAVWLYDHSEGTYEDYTTEANDDNTNDVPMLPDPVGSGDGLYVGSLYKPNWVLTSIGTEGTGTYTIQFMYWNGAAWVAMPYVYDSIGNYKTRGYGRFFFLIPDDIEETTVNGEYMYYIFIRYVSGTVTQQPLGDRIWMNYYEWNPTYIRAAWTGVAAGVME